MAHNESEDDDWLIESAETNEEYVGTLRRGAYNVAMFYNRPTRTLVEREVNHEDRSVIDEPENERSLDAEETLGTVLAEIGDATGWESLSEFAREELKEEPQREET